VSVIFDEEVFPMPPTSMATLEGIGEALLEELCPEMLVKPGPLDAVKLLRDVLPSRGIFIHSASETRLGDRAAATMPLGEKEVQILLAGRLYDQLLDGGRQAYFARSTFTHELSHAVVHMPVVRRRKRAADMFGMAMSRVARKDLEAFVDPEWQAFALGGCLLMPRSMIIKLDDRSAENISVIFDVSVAMAQSHLRRLKLMAR
jgi:hypothetical protein